MRRAVICLVVTLYGLVFLHHFKAERVQVPKTAVPLTKAALVVHQITGSLVSTPSGPVQVRISLTGGRITDVDALRLPAVYARSRALSAYAAPILRREALAAQGSHIDTVTGATHTSDSYAQSLQAALDRARLAGVDTTGTH
jgi:uncharacterized protein with FMN-binding domain